MHESDPFAAAARRAVAVLLDALPELRVVVEDLTAMLGEEPPAQLVFAELAELTTRLAGRPRDEPLEDQLERIFAAVERVAERTDVDSVDHVGFAFLDGLGPIRRAELADFLGPATEELAALLTEDAPVDGADLEVTDLNEP